MAKPAGKKKNNPALPGAAGDANLRQCKTTVDRTTKAFDEDTTIFITMSKELKEEGNKLFQKRELEGAILKYLKAIKLLPKNHIDIAYLRCNMASCYMHMGLGEFPCAINECNLALEVSPKYSKALLKRAQCYGALNRLDLALRDVKNVLNMEPNNLMGLEILDSIKNALTEKGIHFDEVFIDLAIEEQDCKVRQKKKSDKVDDKEENKEPVLKDKKEMVMKTIEEEKEVTKDVKEEKVIARTVKLVLGDDIRWAQLPMNCCIGLLRAVVQDRYPGVKGVLLKYKDFEGDLVTITTTEELRMAELSGHSQGCLRFYVIEVSQDQEPAYEVVSHDQEPAYEVMKTESEVVEGMEVKKGSIGIGDWIIQFAKLFKNHVGFDSDSYLDLHELGVKLYSEAMEKAVTGSESQELFDIAAEKFQEMAALALFNWGNSHLSKARKRVSFSEDGSREILLEQIKKAYEWAKKEYSRAGIRYHEALKIKPDFYESLLALGQQQFEQAKLCWYHAIGSKLDLEDGPSDEVLDLYNKAEDCMEKGMQMWEQMEEQRLNGLSKFDKCKCQLQKYGLDGLLKNISAEELAEQAACMSSQMYLLWGTILYERSVVEYRLELPTWEECLEVAVEKFELAGASPTDIAVMMKNHCSNKTTPAGLGFKIDEIVQAWNEMYDVKRWESGTPAFRLEPLFRRQGSKLHYILENI